MRRKRSVIIFETSANYLQNLRKDQPSQKCSVISVFAQLQFNKSVAIFYTQLLV